MQRKLTLSKGAIVWEKGDAARNIAILEKGKLGVYSGDRLLGVCWPRMVLGESALHTFEGQPASRTATVVAVEDDTVVTEYPPSALRQAVDSGNHPVPGIILTTLVGLICKDVMLVLSTHSSRPELEAPLKGMAQGLVSSLPRLRAPQNWEDFIFNFRFLYDLRDYTEAMRSKLVAATAEHSDAVVRASEKIQDLFKGQDIIPFLEDLLKAERERDALLERSGRVG